MSRIRDLRSLQVLCITFFAALFRFLQHGIDASLLERFLQASSVLRAQKRVQACPYRQAFVVFGEQGAAFVIGDSSKVFCANQSCSEIEASVDVLSLYHFKKHVSYFLLQVSYAQAVEELQYSLILLHSGASDADMVKDRDNSSQFSREQLSEASGISPPELLLSAEILPVNL